jgi:hypothetical protein
MKAYAMTFEGALLERGFWLYVWRVTDTARTVLYVGRTGDSSSPNASSPFKRIGRHLEVGANAKGNALGRQLRRAGLDAACCRFEMVAIGPVFPEQTEMAQHVVFRDQVAALERALADHLRARGYTVLGSHPNARPCDQGLFEQVRRVVDERLPVVAAG